MAAPWSEIEASKEYKGLSAEEQAGLKSDYFKEVISTDADFRALPKEDQGQLQSEFLGQPKKSLLQKVGDAAMYAVTPFAGPAKALQDAAGSVEQADMLKPKMPAGNPLQAAAKAVQQTLIAPVQPLAALAQPNAPLSPSNIASMVSPTPLDVATLGMSTMAKALKAAGLIGKTARAAEEVAKPIEEVFAPAKSMDEAIVRLEAAAKKAPAQPSILLPRHDGPIPGQVLGTNLSKLNTTNDAKRLIADVASANRTVIDDARRGQIAQSETLRLANDLGMTADDLLKRNKGVAFNAEQATASRQVLVSSAEDLVSKAQAAVSERGSLSDFAQQMQRHIMVQAEASGVRAEAGRALGSYRIEAGGNIQKAIEIFLKDPLNHEMTKDIAEKLSKLDPLDTRGINVFVRDASKATTQDKLMEVWVNALLSGPQTHIVNTVSNALTLMTRPLMEKPARAILDASRAIATGTQRERFLGEAGADIFGIIRGIPEGARNALQAFQDGLSAIGPARIEEAVKTASAIKGPLGRVINIPARALSAADEFFKTIARSGELNSLAYRDSVMKGLKGQAKADNIAAILSKQGPEAENIWEQATKEAKYRTFTSDLGEAGNTLNKLRMEIPGARVIVPFLKTPLNVAKFGLERTPLQFANLVNKHGLKNLLTRPELVDELVKPAIGSLLAIPVASAVSQGLITGGGPKDPAKRAVLRSSGWQSYSVKIGNRYYSYGRLEPISMIVGLTADFVELNDIVDSGEAASKIAMAIGQNLTSKTFLRGMSDMLNAVQDPERYGMSWVNRLAGTVVPTGVAQVSRAMTGTIPRPRTPGETIQSRIPGMSKDIPNLRDIWGNVIAIPGSPVERLLSPVYISEMANDKATNEMARLKMGVPTPRARIAPGVELTSDELDFYIKTSGQKAKLLINQFVNGSGYDSLPDWRKQERIQRLWSVAREQASHMLDIPKRKYEQRRKERGAE